MTLNLDKNFSNQLKGAAILLVLLGHMIQNGVIKGAPQDLKYAGAWGVALFLIISGFGLTRAYLARGINISFIGRRLKRILIPYSLITLVWLLVELLFHGKTYSWSTTILLLFGVDFKEHLDVTMWYIGFILLWYLIFYVIFTLPIKNFIKTLLLFGFAYAFRHYSMQEFTGMSGLLWVIHAFLFPLGVLAGLYYERVLKFINPKIALIIMVLLTLACFGFVKTYIFKNNESVRIYSLTNLMAALGIILIFVMAAYFNLKLKFLLFFGSLSYEIYLFEGMFINKYLFAFQRFGNPLLATLSYLVAVFVCSILLKKFLSIV